MHCNALQLGRLLSYLLISGYPGEKELTMALPLNITNIVGWQNVKLTKCHNAANICSSTLICWWLTLNYENSILLNVSWAWFKLRHCKQACLSQLNLFAESNIWRQDYEPTVTVGHLYALHSDRLLSYLLILGYPGAYQIKVTYNAPLCWKALRLNWKYGQALEYLSGLNTLAFSVSPSVTKNKKFSDTDNNSAVSRMIITKTSCELLINFIQTFYIILTNIVGTCLQRSYKPFTSLLE